MMKYLGLIFWAIFVSACSIKKTDENSTSASGPIYEKGTFGYDLDFLKSKDSTLTVIAVGDAQVIVSAKYQGKVFTSTATGQKGKSFGWINYSAFDKPLDHHMNAYGGENRLWLGPEGNKFSLFFKQGTEMTFDNWSTPPAIDTESWSVVSSTGESVSMHKEAELTNYSGTQIKLQIDRTITILDSATISEMTGVKLNGTPAVGYRTENVITNTGQNIWTKENGAPCIWILDMFTPTPTTSIVIPYRKDATGKIVTSDYFGEVSPDRLQVSDGTIVFAADGQRRGKIGVPPGRAKNVAGSFDKKSGVLTIIIYDIDPTGTYLNQEWNTKKNPFDGDAVNAYNDGPLENGSQLGPFYELESVSPAAFLKPGEKLNHTHTVLHFTGPEAALKPVADALLRP